MAARHPKPHIAGTSSGTAAAWPFPNWSFLVGNCAWRCPLPMRHCSFTQKLLHLRLNRLGPALIAFGAEVQVVWHDVLGNVAFLINEFGVDVEIVHHVPVGDLRRQRAGLRVLVPL